ncbi:MAG: copper amine oxidase N-terminal domain-containing protein [Clostridiales bacterium]|nr:copper amine oxidase N-terminal domain-containing protein [Clostridiales bacterium]
MKRFIALILAASIMTTSVFASEITVTLDGSQVEFSAQEPVIEEGRTLIPLRGVFEQLGYEIAWEGETKTATFTSETTVIAITAGSSVFTVNGSEYPLDVPASIINGSMMLPLRAVGEAAGLEVEWDSATKTVSLSSPSSEEITEEETEETTEAETETEKEEETEAETETAVVLEDDISEADLEKLKNCANSESTFYSLDALYYLFGETVEYAVYKINGALEYSYDVSELVNVFDDAIAECKGYKAAANRLKTLTDDQDAVKKYIVYVDTGIEYLQFYYDLLCSVKYSSLSALGIKTKFDEFERELNDGLDDFNDAVNTLVNKVNKVIEIEEYNAEANEDTLTDAQKKGMDSYRREIGEYVTEQVNTIKNASDAYKNGSVFVNAATNIRNRINSTPAPKYCLLDKQVMLRACDLITQAGTAIKNGAYTKDGKNEYFIEYLAVMSAGNILFNKALGDYYNPTEGDFTEIEDEIDIEESDDSITV